MSKFDELQNAPISIVRKFYNRFMGKNVKRSLNVALFWSKSDPDQNMPRLTPWIPEMKLFTRYLTRCADYRVKCQVTFPM